MNTRSEDRLLFVSLVATASLFSGFVPQTAWSASSTIVACVDNTWIEETGSYGDDCELAAWKLYTEPRLYWSYEVEREMTPKNELGSIDQNVYMFVKGDYGWSQGRIEQTVYEDEDPVFFTPAGSPRVTIRWEDSVMIDGGSTSRGTATAAVVLSHIGDTGGLPYFTGGVDSSLATNTHSNIPVDSAQAFSVDPQANLYLELEFEFYFGQAFDLLAEFDYILDVYTTNNTGLNEITQTLDFGHTISWGGLTNIRDADGQLVNDFSLTSESGTNWADPIFAPVPLPATFWLFSSALGLLGWLRRKTA